MSAEQETISRLEEPEAFAEDGDQAPSGKMEPVRREPSPRETALLARTIPPVGKLGGDTSRASARHAGASPHATPTLHVVAHPPADAAERTDAAPRENAVLHADVAPRAKDAPATPSRRPHARRWALSLVLAIAGIAAVVGLIVVALAVAAGRISLPVPETMSPVADLPGGSLRGADLQSANLSDADLQGVDLSEADLRGANVQRANLRRANLAQANLHYALLNDADLREADLRGANMQWVDLEHANLSGAQLEGANLKNARLDSATMPDGSRWSVTIDIRRFTDPTYHDFWHP